MASDPAFAQHVCDQLQGAGEVSMKKMFGEYAIYLGAKVVALVCDDQLFLKPTAPGRALLPNASEGAPYPGAKPYLLLGEYLDDRELLSRVIVATGAALPIPKPKKPRTPRGNV